MPTTKTILHDGERITFTRHGNNDFSLCFEVADYSVRGTMIDMVKTFAEWQNTTDNPPVTFPFHDREICNPWVDTSARFSLTDTDAVACYGIENVLRFIMDVCDLLRSDDLKG